MVEADTPRPDSLERAAAPDVQATYCSTLVDQWSRHGVRHAVVAPGSRSTPMALALAQHSDLSVHVVHDERVAAFVALGLAVDQQPGQQATPALLLCTSGTAAANFYPAVVEAGLSEIPMIVLTADRPEELRGVGAPQTIDQLDLYGDHVEWFHDPGVPEARTADSWRPLATQAWQRSRTGPVQLNLPFREPLVGRTLALPESESDADSFDRVDPLGSGAVETDAVPDDVATERGMILVGGRHGCDELDIVELHRRTGWPIVADPLSGMRHLSTVPSIDAILRVEAVAVDLHTDVIVRLGRPSTSKVLARWSARSDVTLIQVGGPGRIDPAHNVAAVCSLDALLAAVDKTVVRRTDSIGDWSSSWERVERSAADAIDSCLDREVLTEPSIARIVADHLPDDAQLTVSSSMPVRDLEWFGGRRARAHSNRGANGIDGVVSTALGRALRRSDTGVAEFVLIGDLAFVHDSNALVALNRRTVDMRVLVVDNDGGGIFSFLPQATELDHDRFEQLFGTPLGTDVLALAASHGLETADVQTEPDLVAQLNRPGPWVCRVRTDRRDNVDEHRRIHDAVADALS
jgi:2-succinyl-5-enolpyruvyl-6-hydroxy-3-cyclohexene-1-carboxylate synthase